MIDTFLFHMSSFSDSPNLLKEMILKSYQNINGYWYINTDTLKSFIESILYDMR